MGYSTHRTFTAVSYSPGFAADMSALCLSLEGTDVSDHLVTAWGRNGYLSVTLMPHGGKSGSDYDDLWIDTKVRLRRISVEWKAEWSEMTWGGDHEGSPYVETERYKMGAGGVMTSKDNLYPENRDIDPDE